MLASKDEEMYIDIESYDREQFHHYGYKILPLFLRRPLLKINEHEEQKPEFLPSLGEPHSPRTRALETSPLNY